MSTSYIKKWVMTGAILGVWFSAFGQGQVIILNSEDTRLVASADATNNSSIGTNYTASFLGGPHGADAKTLVPLTPSSTTMLGAAGSTGAGYLKLVTATVPGVDIGGSADILMQISGPNIVGSSQTFGPWTVTLGGGLTLPPFLSMGTNLLVVDLAPVNPGSNAQTLPLQNATATTSFLPDGGVSGRYHPSQAIDGVTDGDQGWALISGGAPATFVCQTVANAGFAEGTLLSFKLFQGDGLQSFPNYQLGRFRLSATTDDRSTYADGKAVGGKVDANWIVLAPSSYMADNGAALTLLSDNSILASGGPGATIDTVYTITALTTLTNITGFRLEALTADSLPVNGPGRSGNGNFELQEFQVVAESLSLLANGSFESPILSSNSFTVSTPSTLPAGWSGSPFAVVNGSSVFNAGATWPPPQDGQQYLELGDDPSFRISQNFTVSTAGSYTLSWYDSTALTTSPNTSPYSVAIINSANQTIATNYFEAGHNGIWMNRTMDITLDNGSYTLSFIAQGFLGGWDSLIDNVRLSPLNGASALRIENPSFEALPLASGVYQLNVPGWSISSSGVVSTWRPASKYFTEIPDGVNVCAVDSATVSQILTNVLAPMVTYTLTVAAGSESTPFGGASFSIALYAVDASGTEHLLADLTKTNLIESGTFQDFSVSFTPTENAPNLGDKLEVKLRAFTSGGSQEVAFDRVRVLASSPVASPVTAPPPTIAGISPSSGPASGGTLVSVVGTGFTSNSAVKFGTNQAVSVTFNGPTNLLAVTPLIAQGEISLTVLNPDGQSATLTNAFTAVTAPGDSSSDSLRGDSMQLDFRYPALGTVFDVPSSKPVTFVVGPEVEVPDFLNNPTFSVDVSENSIKIYNFRNYPQFPGQAGFSGTPDHASFNGPAFTDNTSTFTTVSVDPASTLAGLNASRLSWDAHHLYVNWMDLKYDSTTTVILNVLASKSGASSNGPSVLPPPIYLETFDEVGEGTLPQGWMVQNFTDQGTTGFDLSDPKSDAFRDWVVISRDRVQAIGDAGRWNAATRLAMAPDYTFRGLAVTNLVEGNFIYAESDTRTGNQIQYLLSPAIDLTGKKNIHLSYHSIYEQNQDNLGAVEYSIDGGQTWLPVVYMLDAPDVIKDGNGNIDGYATFSTPHSDVAVYTDPMTGEKRGGFFGAFIGVQSNLWSTLGTYISPRVNDHATESKRVELFPLPAAENHVVVVRFVQAGTGSWFWGIDNLGLYSVNDPALGVVAHDQVIALYQDEITPILLAGNDLDLPPGSLSYAVSAAPSHGILSGTAPNVTYRPNAGYLGSDSFQFVVSDGTATSAAATVTITVSPSSQILSAQASVGVGQTVTVEVPPTSTQAGITARLTKTVGTAAAVVSVQNYPSNPTSTPIGGPGTVFLDLRVLGAQPGDLLTADVYSVLNPVFGPGDGGTGGNNGSGGVLVYYDGGDSGAGLEGGVGNGGKLGKWHRVVGVQDGAPSQGPVLVSSNSGPVPGSTTVAFDASTQPKLCSCFSGLGGTVFAIATIAPPTPGVNSWGTVANEAVSMPVLEMLAGASSSTAGPLSITAASPLSAGGGAVALNNGVITYTPAKNFVGVDTFTYTLRDDFASVQATARIIVSSANLPPRNQLSVQRNGSCVTLQFLGSPTLSYVVQWAASATGPWTDFLPGITADSTGFISFTDCPVTTARFYRTRLSQ